MSEAIFQMKDSIKKAIHGKDDVIDSVLCALLAKGHILLEDIPGVGKTTLVTALAKVMNLDYKRIQFTPDVLPSDLTGFNMYDKESGTFRFYEGGVHTNLFLADEINRTSPKTQSALLEAMEEKRVTVDGIVHSLPSPFIVIATQNSQGYVGTFPLPEAQLDRFQIRISMGYPTIEEEAQILRDRLTVNPVEEVNAVMTAEQLADCIDDVTRVNFADSLCSYVARLASATRMHPGVELGASPRASLALMNASRAFAYIMGRDYVIPEDIAQLIVPVFSHRIALRPEMRMKKQTVSSVLQDVMMSVAPPVR